MISWKMHLIISLPAILILACADIKKYSVRSIAKETFFDANLDEPFDKIQEYFSNHDQLKPTGGFTVYPPLSALGSTVHPDSTGYEFNNHPILNSEGILFIYPVQGFARPELLFLFKSFAEAKKFYLDYVSRFPGYRMPSPVADEMGGEFTTEEWVDDKRKIALKVELNALQVVSAYEVRITYMPDQ